MLYNTLYSILYVLDIEYNPMFNGLLFVHLRLANKRRPLEP